jgi:uncharacterized protein YbjT (DUF2867 family)
MLVIWQSAKQASGGGRGRIGEHGLTNTGEAVPPLGPAAWRPGRYFRQVPNIVARHELRLPMADQRIASIDIADIAAVTVQILLDAGHDNQTYPITGPQALTMSEVAAILSKATGVAIRYVDVPPEAARQAQLNAGMPPYLADALAELFAERRAGKESRVSDLTPTLLGRPPTSFAEFATRNAATFQGKQPDQAAD